MIKVCQLPSCGKVLPRNPDERTQQYRRRKYCNSTCTGMAARKPINHGTVSGYNIHLRRGERPCEDCHQARLEWQRNRYPTLKNKVSPRAKARHRAMRLIVSAHMDEYRELVEKLYAEQQAS
jgi:hypothetical protein